MTHYILVNKKPVRCDDLEEWTRQFEGQDRRVAFTQVSSGVSVSTVFLGIDHSHDLYKEPILFESMSFDNGSNLNAEYCHRYSTWEEAIKGHEELVAQVRKDIVRSYEVNIPVKITFDPAKSDAEGMQEVFYDKDAWRLFLLWRPRHIVSEDFNKELLGFSEAYKGLRPLDEETFRKCLSFAADYAGVPSSVSNFIGNDIENFAMFAWPFFRDEVDVEWRLV